MPGGGSRAAPQGIDAAVDCVGTDEAVDVSLAVLAVPQQLVTIAAWHRLGEGIRGVSGRPGTDAGVRIRDAARLRLTALVEDGVLGVVVARVFPLAEAAEATRLLVGGHAGGKVVLVP